eukprot:768789-Hanusia_phi.AAC.2
MKILRRRRRTMKEKEKDISREGNVRGGRGPGATEEGQNRASEEEDEEEDEDEIEEEENQEKAVKKGRIEEKIKEQTRNQNRQNISVLSEQVSLTFSFAKMRRIRNVRTSRRDFRYGRSANVMENCKSKPIKTC